VINAGWGLDYGKLDSQRVVPGIEPEPSFAEPGHRFRGEQVINISSNKGFVDYPLILLRKRLIPDCTVMIYNRKSRSGFITLEQVFPAVSDEAL